ncbi:rhodanese-related sulfurtransferase [Acinetobacter qingfengensis]|uniref:tRNA uridine(34) hydroxylase n=1 Tax=Acinetobacter qingfengensis TaxID=1262585 RepID=A0A1E7RFL8_9GAMM|nr:rhodanese-related sulfurtransferase [Acinetobacter qingfengensis]KAA8732803.1 rhodanese-related sulfurtransferase [Acinetobacter qingfengensis]OEY98086.1 rhodanese-like domain-containing protein [Acinetobacter qingfengensis]
MNATVEQLAPVAEQANTPWVVAALYQFREVADPADLRERLINLVQSINLCGTLIVAGEGINGTVAGDRHAIDSINQFLQNEGFDNLEYKESESHEKPFRKMKIKLKKEIVTLGVEVKPRSLVGHYCDPEEWNELISRDDVILIDTRNDYEYKAGTFQGAIDPQTETFREFPDYVRQQLANHKDKKVAMFCTGGIRCEKSTSLLLQEGFKDVYHLKGGILKYLEEMPAEKSLWKGECFVFDGRTAVTHGLQEGINEKCHACGWPTTPEERALPSYEHGVSCIHCIDKTTEQQKEGFRMRQSQIVSAKRKRL